MRRVLILTASYGSGHNEAARCLATEVSRQGATPIVVDHFRALVGPAFDRLSRAAYMGLLRHAPAVWGLAYALGDRMASDSWMTFGASRMGCTRLEALLTEMAPHAVVTVHATPALALAALARAGHRLPPHTTVITDFVAHNQWIAPGIDRYCVAADEVGHELIARGIPRERVIVTGVPVRSDFSSTFDSAEARRAFGVTSGPVVLGMAGSWGSVGRLPDVGRALLRCERPVHGILVAGRDERLRETLERRFAGTPLCVLGFVPEMARLMAAADLIVTKAGGMTLAEAMAAEAPLLLYGSLPGQEQRNERFASRAGLALVARDRLDLQRRLERALAEPELLDEVRACMRARRRPEATRAIVALVLADAARRTPAR